MIELTPEQSQALAAEETPTVIDPVTKETYVLVPSAAYERLRHLFEDEEALSKREVALLIERAMRDDDANDPALERYQDD